MKPPRPSAKKTSDQQSQTQCLTKKERIQIDKNVEIQRANRIMLRKLLEIDLKHSDLHKKNVKPLSLKLRSLSSSGRTGSGSVLGGGTVGGSNHPQLQINLKSRFEELQKVNYENQIILRKLQGVKANYNVKEWEQDSQSKLHFSHQMAQSAGRFTKHPFFTQENPAASYYRKHAHSSYSKKRQIVEQYKQFSHTFYQDGGMSAKSIENQENENHQPCLNPPSSQHSVIPAGNEKKKRRKLKKKSLKEHHLSAGDVGLSHMSETGRPKTASKPFFIQRHGQGGKAAHNTTFEFANRSQRHISTAQEEDLSNFQSLPQERPTTTINHEKHIESGYISNLKERACTADHAVQPKHELNAYTL